MSQDRQSEESAKKHPVLGVISFTLVILVVVLGWLFVSRASFTIGNTRSRFLIQNVSKMSGSSNFDTNAILINIGWSDPTGEITHGRAYGLRIGSHVFELDTYYAPTGFKGTLSNF